MGENVCKPCNQQGINLQNLQTGHITQYFKKKKKNLSKKWGKTPKKNTSPRRQTDGQEAQEKILNITNY